MERFSIDDLLAAGAELTSDMMERLADISGVALFNLYLPTGEIKLNHATTLLAGYEPGELPHSENTKLMLTFEPDRPIVAAAMGKLMQGEADSYTIEYRMRRQDGSIVSIKESALVIERDEAGTPVRIAGLAIDLSRLRWAEDKARAMEQENRRLALAVGTDSLAEQNRLWRAANAASAMIIGGFHQDYETVLCQALQLLGESLDADRCYIWRNKEVDGQIACYPRAEWAKTNHSSPVAPGTVLFYDDFMPNWREIAVPHTSIRTLTKDLDPGLIDFPGMQDVLSIMLVPLFLHGEFWGFIGFDDCSKERPFEEYEGDIMAAGALVVASSVSRNETFGKLNEARQAAMASTQAKSEFLSRMSHEIRTPMNAIIGMTTIAKKTSDPEKIRYCLDKVDASSRQLLSIINDVLDMSKIDANKFEISHAPFDFEKMMQNVFNVVQVKLEEKHQDFHLDIEHPFTRMAIGDELRLSQVLINLLNNAMKFTPESGLITLRVREAQLDDDTSRLHVEVVDTGIGIDPDQQARLFQSFEQADGGISRQYGGTGLGLAICKKIINLMNGDIWVESTPGKGSSFIFEVPMSWGEVLTPAVQPSADPSRLRILVVDDSDDVLEYFRNILGNFSIQCDTVSSGKAALVQVQQSIADRHPYDMVFVDWNMPGMNGGTTAQGIRQLAGNDIIIVMISVADWADIEKEAQAFGVSHFLAKPVLPSVLYNTIVELTDNNLVTAASAGESAVPNWAGKTILLAEDIEINREIMANVLEETQVTIDYAEDGQQAVDAFSRDPARYSLILMDVQMPRMDGLSATRAIRAMNSDHAKAVPIVAMTANAFKEDEQLCLDAGMNAHVAKPLDLDAFFHTLGRFL